MQHQKAKHFKCFKCYVYHKKHSSAGGMVIRSTRNAGDGFPAARCGEAESVCQLEFDLGNMLLSWVLGLFFY